MKPSGISTRPYLTPQHVLCPAGWHPAVCVEVYELGTTYNEYRGCWQEQVSLVFEFPGVRRQHQTREGIVSKPHRISWNYTLSFEAHSNLRRDIESWRGYRFSQQELQLGYDVCERVGKPAHVLVAHRSNHGRIHARLNEIKPLAAGVPIPKAEGPLRVFALKPCPRDELDGTLILPAWLPRWVAERIKLSREYRSAVPEGREEEAFQVSLFDRAGVAVGASFGG